MRITLSLAVNFQTDGLRYFVPFAQFNSFMTEAVIILSDLQGKSVDWFLYDNGLRHERAKKREKHPQSSITFTKVSLQLY